MSQALPPNLINVSVADLNLAFNQGLDFTSPEALLTLWKFYAASSSFDSDPIAVRSRNLFWRLLRSPQKAKSIGNLQLAGLWRSCQDEEAFEPIQLPERFQRLRTDRTSKGRSSNVYPSEEGKERASGDIGTPLVRAGPSGGARAGKRRSGDSAGSYDHEISPRTNTPEIASESGRPGLRRNTSSKGRTPTIASSSRGRAKPSLPRRRSSQTRSQPSTAQVSPRPALRSPNAATATTSSPPAVLEDRLGDSPIGSTEPAFTLPSASSWQSVDEASEQPSAVSSAVPAPRGSLVDRDFRRNFVGTQRQMSSATNLPTLGRGRKAGSMVRFDDVPEVIGKGKEKERTPSAGQGSTETSRRLSRSDSQVVSDSEDSDGVVMPRVQSNLSKLIKDVRQQSGGREMPPGKGTQSGNGQSAASRKKDEEILEMGRKAGAPLIPKGRPGSNIAERMRSPSPGATF